MKPSIFLMVVACAVLLSACGNKGPLVLPTPKPIPTRIPVDHTAGPLSPAADKVSESARTDAETDNEDSDE